MAIIIPHQLSLAPPPVPPPVFSGPLPNPQRSAFLFPAVRFFVSSNLLSRPLRSASSFPLFRIFVPFGPFFRSLCFASSFLSVCSFVFFGLFLRFFRSALSFSSVRFLFLLVRFYEALCRSQVFSLLILSLLLSGIFVPFKSDTRLSTLETMPFNVRDHALLAPRPRPSMFKKTPFFSPLRMCLISCQLQVPFRFIPSSLHMSPRMRFC